ncbi:MAG: hypothetical protein K6A29_05505 [Lachnospiraceae bacterium]|nr:hypothetical protein [Lachnospiraceae bacterium]
MRKKIYSIALTAIMALSLTACGNKAEEASVSSTEISEEVTAEAPEVKIDGSFVLMNIPYSDFFASEFEGGENVDAVSSATMNKPSNENLTSGTYHPEDNSKILGVSFPVLVSSDITLDESLKVNEEAALYSAADYSYVELSDVPSNYKTLSVKEDGSYSFGKYEGEAESLNMEVSVNTDTHWGDYEIDMDESLSEQTVLAASVHTTDGKSYGFRSLENIWRGFEIAFATTENYKEPHGNEVVFAPYSDMPGKTIDEITLYTKDGVKVITTDLYLPLKFDNTIDIKDAAVSDKETTFSLTGFPEDYSASFSVDNEAISCDGEKITWESILAGAYTLTVSDENGVYAPYSQSFVLSTDKAVAVAAEDGVKKDDSASDEEFSAYVKNITGYVVNGEEVAGSGKRGARIITEDGSADKTLSRVFKEVGDYEVKIISAGYPDLTINVNITEVAPSEDKGEKKH